MTFEPLVLRLLSAEKMARHLRRDRLHHAAHNCTRCDQNHVVTEPPVLSGLRSRRLLRLLAHRYTTLTF